MGTLLKCQEARQAGRGRLFVPRLFTSVAFENNQPKDNRLLLAIGCPTLAVKEIECEQLPMDCGNYDNGDTRC